MSEDAVVSGSTNYVPCQNCKGTGYTDYPYNLEPCPDPGHLEVAKKTPVHLKGEWDSNSFELVKPNAEILACPEHPLMIIERAGRNCHASAQNIKMAESPDRFVRFLIDSGHMSVIEHVSVTCWARMSRVASHQWVRHRLASYSQESQRYHDYLPVEDPGKVQMICPPTILELRSQWKLQGAEDGWSLAIERAIQTYKDLLRAGIPQEDARSILPTCTKTEIVTTFNLREWRHFFNMRCSVDAQGEIRGLAIKLLAMLKERVPVVFEDFTIVKSGDGIGRLKERRPD